MSPRSSCSQIARLLVLAGLASPVLATPRSWITAGGGSAATAANWNPAAVPVAADALSYGLANNYTVTFNSSVPTVNQHNFNAGTVSLSALSPHTVTGQFVAGLTGTSTVNIIGGQFSVGGTVAMASAAPGVLTVTGPTSSFVATNPAATMRIGNGNAVNGTLNVLNGGLVQSVGPIVAGAFNNSVGTITVSGQSGATHSRLETTDAVAGDITLGSAGNASMTINSGGQVACADDFNIAPVTGFIGSLIGGGAGVNTLQVAGDLRIASNTTAAAAGDGSLTINAGFVVTAGATFIGDPNGGTGVLHVTTASTLNTGSLTVDPANGSLQHDDGQVRVTGGVCSLGTPDLVLNGSAAGNLPTLMIDSGASLSLPGNISVGTTRDAKLSVFGGLATVTAQQDVFIGQAPGGGGLVEVFGGGTLTIPSNRFLLVGQNGDGLLHIDTNGTVNAGTCDIASQVGSTGEVSVDGANARLNVATLYVGGNSGGAHGNGTLQILNSGAVTATGDVLVYSGTGSITMSGASTLTAGGTVTINGGSHTLSNATINAVELTLNNPTLSMSGLVNADVNMSSSVTTINANGPLTMGRLSSPSGFRNLGTLNAGVHAVTLRDSNNAVAGNVILSGGSLTAVNGASVLAGDTVSGFGTINANVSNVGTISPTGVGLTLGGVISGTGQAISGTTLTFASGGGFTGQGTVNTQVISQAGSTITATGVLTLGDSSALADKAQIGGAILGGPFTVQLFDATQALVTGSFELQGGFISSFPNATGVHFKRIGVQPALLSGNGSSSVVIHNNGRVNPGTPSADPTRTISFTAGYDQRGYAGGSPGTYEVDIDGASSSNVDRLNVTGTAFLDGTLIVNRVGGFMPSVGQSYTILNATTVSGTFPLVIAEGFEVVYSPTTVTLVFHGICDSADFNCDEDFGTDADIEAFFACLGGNCPASPCGNDQDFNNDGDFGTDADIEAFFRVLGGGNCS